MAAEKWRPIPGYARWYLISSNGRVLQKRRLVRLYSGKIKIFPEIIITTKINNNGYHYVHLLGNLKKGGGLSGRRKYWNVHRLVLLAFVGKKPKGKHVCHNNGIASDNRLSNLRYDTPQGNTDDMVKQGRARGWDSSGVNNGKSKLTEAAVLEIRRAYATGTFLQRELGAKYGVQQASISKVVLGITYTKVGNVK